LNAIHHDARLAGGTSGWTVFVEISALSCRTGFGNMKRNLRRALLFWTIGVLLFSSSQLAAAAAAPAPIDGALYAELLKSSPDRKIVEVDGVPCIKIFLPKGQSISYFCRFVKYFDKNFHFYRQQIALINRLEPMAVVEGDDSLSTDVKFIYVPLNFSIRPKILPERLAAASRVPKFILIDIGQQCLGLYENGKLMHQFPISSGRSGTPAKKFVILSKEKDHYSTKYDYAWMPYSMRLYGNYFLHAGILPSYAASHGCVRVIYENMVFVYNWADVGTPGEVVNPAASGQRFVVPVKERAENQEEADIKTLF